MTTEVKETTVPPQVVSTKFSSSLKEPFPAEMRRQLWPLCCGASILSGFKNVGAMTEAQLVENINTTIDKMVPDFQVYNGERMTPKLTFLTLNATQMSSATIMNAIKAAGFVKFAQGQPRGGPQGFFVKDTSNTFKLEKLG